MTISLRKYIKYGIWGLFYIYSVTRYFYAYMGWPSIWVTGSRWGIVLLGVVAIFLTGGKIPVRQYVKITVIMLLISAFSSIYSLNDNALNTTFIMFEIFLIAYFLVISIISEKDIKVFFQGFALCGGVIFILSYINDSLHMDDRFGRTLTDGHLNSFASLIMLTLISAIICVYLAESKKVRALNIALIIAEIYMLVLSGGRKFIIVPVIFVFLLIFNHNKFSRVSFKKVVYLIVALAVVMFGWNYIMTNPIAFKTLGYRFIDIRNESSAMTRLDLISMGMKYFIRSPIWGYGENSVEILSSMTIGTSLYAHNNYVELLVNFGLIGFIIYYSYHYFLLKHLHQFRHNANAKYFAIFRSLVISLMFLDLTVVSYYSTSMFCIFLWITEQWLISQGGNKEYDRKITLEKTK